MKDLIIIGARGFGREVFDFAQHCLGYNESFAIKGFLDDKKDELDSFANYPPIISNVENYEIKENDVFIIGLGSVKWVKYYAGIIESKGGEFLNLIHKNAVIRNNVKLGKGIIVGAGSLVSTDVIIGNFTQIMSYCIIGHDVVINEFCRLGDFVFLGGFTNVGSQTFLSVRATIMDRVKIGSNAVIGMGSVVLRNIPDSTTVFGNPAKRVEY
jgi:sugar O-acyltransferase (sialic acid O-acetyltransferase NeuD family)